MCSMTRLELGIKTTEGENKNCNVGRKKKGVLPILFKFPPKRWPSAVTS